MPPPGLLIRPYQASDHDAVYDVCVRTGDSGGDARGLFPNDDLLPDIYAGPYLYLEPELALVLDDRGSAVGYVIGTADTARFVRRYRREWLPTLGGRHPELAGGPASPHDQRLAELYHPERMLVGELTAYPAHLHIDVLPDYQRGGYGRRLIETFLDAVWRAGAGGVHLAVASANTGAQEFYKRVGFELVTADNPPGSGYCFGRRAPAGTDRPLA